MTSKALDLTTMGHALTAYFTDDPEWIGISDDQQEFLSWYADHRNEIDKLSDLEALVSTDFAELNSFLMSHGFNPMFGPFTGIGVVSILDMLVQWLAEGTPTVIERYEQVGHSIGNTIMTAPVNYPAFRIYSDGVDIYDVAGYEHPLVQLYTKTGHSLWLMKADEPASGLELNCQVQRLLTSMFGLSRQYWSGVKVPMLQMDVRPDLSWMLGMCAVSASEKYVIKQAFQQFKLRANHEGAHVEVATGFAAIAAACGPLPQPYVFDEPFIGFFTQPENDTLSLAAFWADTDSWRDPGSIE